MIATATPPARKPAPAPFDPADPQRLLEELNCVGPTILEITPSAPLPVTGRRRWKLVLEVTLDDDGLHPALEKVLAEKTAPTTTAPMA